MNVYNESTATIYGLNWKGGAEMENRFRIMSEKDLPLIMGVKEVGEVLGVSKNKVYQVFHSKGFPGFKVGSQHRVSREKFFKWLDSMESSHIIN
jgi:excisionase family DNA binding protein